MILMRCIAFTFLFLIIGLPLLASESANKKPEQPQKAFVIPIEGQISKPQLFILRRGLKEAMRKEVNTVIIEINTPGGDLKSMLEMMEALDKFEGTTIAFINKEAISAGSFISMACDVIYFAPQGLMGAAAAVMAGGQEIPETMTLKIESYLNAKTRSLTQEHRYRAEVQRAMMDKDYELKIDGEILKAKGELLTLTAQEAIKKYGNPPLPLLATGIVNDVDELLDTHFWIDSHEVKRYELTWSEGVAKWVQSIAPILMGLGMLCLFIEFKTPGFGIFGFTGISALLLVFGSHYLAGLAGHEEILVFLMGVTLLVIEIFFIPGTIIAGATGIVLIIGSLLWAMADVWPSDSFSLSPDIFVEPIMNMTIGLIIALIGSTIVLKFLPRTSLWEKLVLSATVPSDTQADNTDSNQSTLPGVGSRGVTITPLHPSGQVEINGKRFEAKCGPQTLSKGTAIEVTGYDQFELIVREKK